MKKAQIITIVNHKGGVGKTTTAINLGIGLAHNKKKVLIIDLDPQANLTQSMGILDEQTQTIYGALRGAYSLPAMIVNGVDITPSELNLCGAEIELTGNLGREFILRDLLEEEQGRTQTPTELKRGLSVLDKYDFVIIDAPPSLGLLTTNALASSNYVIIPVQSEYLALQGLNKLHGVIELVRQKLNPGLKILGVLLTRYDSRKVLNKNIEEALRGTFEGRVFNTVIRENIAIAEAPAMGKDVITYAPKSNGAQDYLQFTAEALQLLNEQPF
jgi:chromosome partitioning protein